MSSSMKANPFLRNCYKYESKSFFAQLLLSSVTNGLSLLVVAGWLHRGSYGLGISDGGCSREALSLTKPN